MWEQKETGSEGELGEDVGPTVFGRFRGLGDDPELAAGMMDERDGMAGGGCDGPTAAEEVDLVVGIASATEVEGQVQVEEAGGGSRAQRVALLGQGFGPSVVGGETRGAANRPVLAREFLVQKRLGWAVGGDALVGQQGDQTFLEGAEAAFDLALGLRARSDQVGDAERGEGALELRARIPPVGGGLVAEEGQPVGVEGQRPALPEERAAEVLEMVPGGVGGDEGAGEVSAGVVIDGEQEGLLGVAGPPLMDGGVVLPEFADAGTFPAPPRLGHGLQGADQQREVSAGMSGDGLAVAVEGETGDQFVGDQLVIGGPLQRQKGLQEALNLQRPGRVLVAPGSAQGEGCGLAQPSAPEAEQMRPADLQKPGRSERIKLSPVKGREALGEELRGEALGELGFVFSQPADPLPLPGPSLPSAFATLRPPLGLAPAAESPFVLPPVSFCSLPNTKMEAPGS